MTAPPTRTVQARYFGGDRPRTTHVVWHATAGTTADSSLGWLNRATARTDGKGVAGYHVLIERDGTVIYHTPLGKVAYHAGVSHWPQPDGPSMNARSIGIAFCNRQLPTTHAKFEAITEKQIESAAWVIRTLPYPAVRTFSAHVRHVDVAPKRRSDPTPATLDWRAFLDYLRAHGGVT